MGGKFPVGGVKSLKPSQDLAQLNRRHFPRVEEAFASPHRRNLHQHWSLMRQPRIWCLFEDINDEAFCEVWSRR